MAKLGQYLESNGVHRRLLDIAAFVPSQTMRFLNDREMIEANLSNTMQVYAGWKLDAGDDGSLYAYVEQQNPITDSRTRLVLYKKGGFAVLDMIYYPPQDPNEVGLGDGDIPVETRDRLGQVLSEVGVWLRVDEQVSIRPGSSY